MPARDPSAAPMAHLSTSTSQRHKHPHAAHLESGLYAGRRGSLPASAAAERPAALVASSVKSADGVAQLPIVEGEGHDPQTGRSKSISGIPPSAVVGGEQQDSGGRRKSLWQSFSGMTGGDAPGRRSSNEDGGMDAGMSGVLSHHGSAGGSGWFSVRGDSHSVYSAGDDT